MKTAINTIRNMALAAALFTTGALPAFAASEEDYKTALTAAEAAQKDAAALRNRWTVTESALAAARKSAAAGDYDAATASAREAEALAKASVFQATSEKQRWKEMEIR